MWGQQRLGHSSPVHSRGAHTHALCLRLRPEGAPAAWGVGSLGPCRQELGTLPRGLAPGHPQTTGPSPPGAGPKRTPHNSGVAEWDGECGPPPAQHPSVHLECGGPPSSWEGLGPLAGSMQDGRWLRAPREPRRRPACCSACGAERGLPRGQSFKGQERLRTPSLSSLEARPILGGGTGRRGTAVHAGGTPPHPPEALLLEAPTPHPA